MIRRIMQVLLVVALVLAGALLAPVPLPPVTAGGEAALVNALATTDYQFQELRVQGWIKLNAEYLDQVQLGEVASKAAAQFAIQDVSLDYFQEQRYHGISWEGITASGSRVYAAVQSMPAVTEQEPLPAQTYLVLEVADNNDVNQLTFWQGKLEQVLQLWSPEPSMGVTIIATREGKLEPPEQQASLYKLLSSIRTTDINEINDGYLISVSGYSPMLTSAIVVGERRVNINAALRYHSSDGLTYLYLGSPLIFSQY